MNHNLYFRDVFYKLMKKTYGDIFHKPTIIKQKENDVMKKIILEIKEYTKKNSFKLLKSETNQNHLFKESDIQRFSYIMPYLYMKTSFQLISNVLSK